MLGCPFGCIWGKFSPANCDNTPFGPAGRFTACVIGVAWFTDEGRLCEYAFCGFVTLFVLA